MDSPLDLVGKPMDILPFGNLCYWTGTDAHSIQRHEIREKGPWQVVSVPEQGGYHIGVEWDNPRRFSKVVVRYADGYVPEPGQVTLQYWNHTWPEKWAGGWTAVEDPYNGRWVTAHDNVEISGNIWTHTFDPLDIVELPHAEDYAVTFRQSLKMRLLMNATRAVIEEIQVFSDSVWRTADLKIEFGIGQTGQAVAYDSGIEVHNGHIVSLCDSDPRLIHITVLYADTGADLVRSAPLHPDATIITVECVGRRFSFRVSDALDDGIYIPDLGVFISEGKRQGFSAWSPPHKLSIYDRVAMEPEQSYERARSEIPQLGKTRQPPYGRYCPIGCDANRQEFAVRYNGDIFVDKELLKPVGRDTARLLWPGKAIWFRFPTGETPDFREGEDMAEQSALRGYLPIYVTRWFKESIEYEQTTFAALLHESPWDEEHKRGDEPVVALTRIRLSNQSGEDRTAKVWFVIEQPEELALDEGFVYAVGRVRNVTEGDPSSPKSWLVERYESPRMRAFLDMRGKGTAFPACCSYPPLDVQDTNNAIVCNVHLHPGETHEIDFRIPFVTYTGESGRLPLRQLDYEAKLQEMIEYWEAQINEGALIRVPEGILNDFNRANVAHVAITVDKDVTSGLYILGAATWGYQVFGTETVDQVRSLDLRGYHERARKYIMPFVELQGSRRMDGRFSTQEGTLHGVRVSNEYDYQVGDYSLDHGAILWMLGEHYRLTRDTEWLRSIAQNIIDACDYISREREVTKKTSPDGSKVWEYGLLPPCHLDDNPEWMYWYAVNAMGYRGMMSSAQVLAEIGHPESQRITRQANEYGEDIRRALKISMELSPVVQLLDGTYIPHLPVRAYLRGRDVGWIREALYGPILYIDAGLIGRDTQEATWILKDHEDNVFVSKAVGRNVDLEHDWFSQGGITIQSNLLPNPLVYLARGQVEHAIRAFYNSFAASLYADVRCFTEHPVAAYGWGQGPFYKTPDECAFLTWLRYLLIMEMNDTLFLTPGTPRKWLEQGKEIEVCEAPTYFGPVSFKIVSDKDKVSALVQPPRRNRPNAVILRLRHPEKKDIKSVKVNSMPWSDFDAEMITLPATERILDIEALYA